MKKLFALMILIGLCICMFASCSKDWAIQDTNTRKLYSSIDLGNEEAIRESIQDGANIDKIKVSSFITVNTCEFAYEKRRFGTVIWLINNGADPNYRLWQNSTLLMSFSLGGQIDLCQQLLQCGADINAQDRFGYTALEYAFIGESAQSTEKQVDRLVTLLLTNGAQVRSRTFKAAIKGSGNNDGDCKYALIKRITEMVLNAGHKTSLDPLLEQAILGNSEKVDKLINSGKINEKDKQLILFFTAAFGKPNTIKMLEKKGIDLNSRDSRQNTVLITAARYGNDEMVRFLVDAGVEIDKQNYYSENALIAAVMNEHATTVRYLLGKGANPVILNRIVDHTRETSVLCYAAATGNVEIMKDILESGYNPTKEQLTEAIIAAAGADKVDSIDFCHDLGADINKEIYGETALHLACLKGNFNAVKSLIMHGAAVNGFNRDGTPIRAASTFGKADVVQCLIENGADVNAVQRRPAGAESNTALNAAVMSGNYDIVKILVENGARKGDEIITAAKENSRNILAYLIQNGFYVNYQDEEGNTPLIYAAKHFCSDNLKILLKYNADKTVKNSNGKTACDVAKEERRLENHKLLKLLE